MKKILIAAAVAALTVVPNAFAGPSATAADHARAVNDCESVRPSMNRTVGAGTFARAFRTVNPFRQCVRAFTAEEHANRHAVFAACGEPWTTRRAFGECVAAGRRAASREDRREWVNAAQWCKAEREANPGAFAEPNAYGKCVSTYAKAQEDDEPEA